MNRVQWWLSGRVFDSLSDFFFRRGFEPHPHHKIFFWYVKKGGFISPTFLVCLPPKCQNFWVLKKLATLLVWNKLIFEKNQKFIQRQTFYATQKLALFWPSFGQKWTQKDREPNYLELRDFVFMSQVILEETRNHSSKKESVSWVQTIL